jgi:tetratricopeptide (TPR) repeat protein
MDWFNQWIQAYSQYSQKDYAKAIAGFKQLESNPVLRNEKELLVSMGKAEYYNGDFDKAINSLARAHRLDANSMGVSSSR